MSYQTQRPVADIIGDLFNQATSLFGKETQLMRAELSENVGRVGRGIGLLVGGAVLLIPALVILLQAATAALIENYQLASYWSALIVGGVTLIVGLILVMSGAGRLRAEELMPDRTVRQLRRDATVVKQQVGGERDIQRAA
ncbi:tetrahydromethanopterin S-methyltransferase subunit G [Rhodoblastus acidophilus]|uniref:phage holin family protein n=1 Tax=Rhodoblastus acidophilus TaxID=1074 RepID=UPI001618AD3C|nr:phage holin family protein [Rhodoblastus acidophilus]MCW2284584.1 tetrahydromethanopterin S-methyltransferase subunit G [Rhodoblastus acidophilus]MCW2333537.1 tetrahydromethanopterin S-methyltransferase subunit G [Rhodoblastus acidophilus]